MCFMFGTGNGEYVFLELDKLLKKYKLPCNELENSGRNNLLVRRKFATKDLLVWRNVTGTKELTATKKLTGRKEHSFKKELRKIVLIKIPLILY
jgi:hypothetical protein